MTTKSANSGRGALSRFAHLAGFGKPKAEDVPSTEEHDNLEDKVDTVEDKVDELEERVDDVEDKVDDEDEKPDPEEPGEDKPEARAAYRKGKANGRKVERARGGAILGLKAAATNVPLAMHLAYDTACSPQAALDALKAAHAGAPPRSAPTADTGKSKLDSRMQGAKPIAVGSGGPGAPDPKTPEGAAAGVLATLEKFRGKKGA